jgi:sortase A
LRRRSKIAKLAERLCWLVAAIALGWVYFAYADSFLFQTAASRRLDALLQGSSRTAAAMRAVRAPPEGTLLGRITIPSLKMSAVIVEGDDSSVLRHAVGHIRGTSLPGADGNIALAAHRDTFFRSLGKLHEDDEILISDAQGTQRYRVDHTAIVPPQDTDVLSAHRGPALTLVTCYPFQYIGSAPDRYVVIAWPESRPAK